jgi:hypothetical protein
MLAERSSGSALPGRRGSGGGNSQNNVSPLRDVSPQPVLVSYSTEDSTYVADLITHLTPLAQHGYIELIEDFLASPDARWEQYTEEILKEAVATIMLVSHEYVASDRLMPGYLPRLLTTVADPEMLIRPIILSHSSFNRLPHLRRFRPINPDRPLARMRKWEKHKMMGDLADEIARKVGAW